MRERFSSIVASPSGKPRFHHTGRRRRHQPRWCFQRCAFCRAWTMTVMSGIVPQHACSGTMWGTASIRTWRFRSAPRLPILAAVTTPFVPLNSRRDSLGCGYVDNARALPTYPQPNNSSSQLQFDFEAAAITGRTFASRCQSASKFAPPVNFARRITLQVLRNSGRMEVASTRRPTKPVCGGLSLDLLPAAAARPVHLMPDGI
jgi:hypothetical protein